MRHVYSDDGIGIPYPPADRAAGSRCQGYFDLKSDPSLIDKIPELKNEPELRSLVKEITQATYYMTTGCDTWAVAAGPSEMHQRKAGSYVGICFEDVVQNNPRDVFEKMCAAFTKFAADQPSRTVWVEFETKPATFHDHNGLSGWVVAIFVYGYGATSLDAKKSWKRGIRALSDFFKSPHSQLLR